MAADPFQAILTVGVVSDTHMPDRAHALHPKLIPDLKSARVDQILHAGDISTPTAIEELETVAPVTAVRGNRDWAFVNTLPVIRNVNLAGVLAVLLHGHGGFFDYWRIKSRVLLKGYSFSTFRPVLERARQGSQIVIFGHSHVAENRWIDGVLYFNPGAVSMTYDQQRASYGIIKINTNGAIDAKIYPLEGYTIRGREWVGV